MFERLTAALAITQKGDEPYGDAKYADPGFQKDGKKRYPLNTVKRIKAAWRYIHEAKNREPYTEAQLTHIENEIIAAWKEKIDSKGPPETQVSAGK